MRTTSLGQARTTLLNLRSAAERIGRASQQISSGLRVERPSDGPADAAAIVRTRSDLAEIARFRSNLEGVSSELRAVDGSLFDAVAALQRAAQIAAQGASDTTDERAREALAGEAEGVFRHVASIANSLYGGRYVFAGSLDERAPFVIDDHAAFGIRYVGDDANRALTFPDRRPAAVSLPGDAIFLTPDEYVGAGRAATTAVADPALPVGLGISFGGDIEGVLSVDLRGPYLAPASPSGALAGDTVAVSFASDDGTIAESITTAPLAGGEDATAIAAALNAAITANPALAGLASFSNEGGALKLTVSNEARTGFSFTASSAGGVTTGLEGGGSAGGYSAEEIATALNAAVAQDSALNAAGVQFEALDGEVSVDAKIDFTFTAVDFDRGTGFRSGLAGVHRVGGDKSANVFGSLKKLITGLETDDAALIAESVSDLQRAVDQLSRSQAFYGATLGQAETTLATLADLENVNLERLSNHQDADILDAISDLQSASNAEQFAIQVAARQRPKLLDVLG